MMFKDKYIHKLYAFALAAVFALVLAGCGGGGGGSTAAPPDEPPQMPTPQETCEGAGGRWNADETCTSAADLAQEMVDAAQMAAATAAAAADTALNSAKAAFNAIAGLESYDELHYNLAAGALDDARRAKQAADDANQAAMDAGTPEAAQAARARAEQAQKDAEAALANAMMFADAVTAAKTEADRIAQEELDRQEQERIAQENAMKISDAQDAARMASEAASAAAMAAATALETLQADADATANQLVTATTAKIAADAAARDAADAYAAAMSADTVEAAESARDDAQMAQMVAEAQKGIIDGFNMANQDNRNDQTAEDERMQAVTDARTAAQGSATAASTAADNADAAATRVEEIAPGTAAARAAREAATAARTAADAAQAAHDAIMDSDTAEAAQAHADEAATQATNASNSYMTASGIKDTTETNLGIAEEENRKRDVAAATTAANAAATAAKEASDAAEAAADAAETARANAKAVLDRAKAARTDATEAEKQYEAAKEAAEVARTAANTAMQAYTDAKAAADGIDAGGLATAAETAQMTAEEEQRKAETAKGTADTQKTAAETAEDAAEMAAGTHVLRLFQAANGDHVMDVESTEADEKEQHANNVGAAMAHVAGAANGNQAAGATNAATFTAGTAIAATASWLGDTTADLDATPAVEFAEGMLSISVTVNGGSAITSELRESRDATDLNGDGDTDDTGEAAITQNARKIADLGDFAGYEIWEVADAVDTTREGARVIVFTNKQKGTDSVLAVTAATARSANRVAITSPGELAKVTSTGTTITGVEWTPSGDTAPLTGTLSCPANTACDITLGADGVVTAISGYVFTGSRAARAEVTAAPAAENNNYLMFGFWLDENDDGATDTFGAFATGPAAYADAIANEVTGTASYSGKAAGAHHKTGDGVNWFEGDASLTANFGADDAAGTISGQISNIRVNGGEAMSTPIYLGQADLTTDSATFNGAAFMGEPTAPGASTHEFDGTWSGSFFGPTEDDTDTADVDESITAPLAAAGTFGVTKSTGAGDDMVVESFVGAFGANKQ